MKPILPLIVLTCLAGCSREQAIDNKNAVVGWLSGVRVQTPHGTLNDPDRSRENGSVSLYGWGTGAPAKGVNRW